VGTHRIDTVSPSINVMMMMMMMMMTVADELEKMSKKSAMAYFKVLSQSSPGKTKEIHKRTSMRIVSLQTKNQIQDLWSTMQKF
jgi:hypothetical protein